RGPGQPQRGQLALEPLGRVVTADDALDDHRPVGQLRPPHPRPGTTAQALHPPRDAQPRDEPVAVSADRRHGPAPPLVGLDGKPHRATGTGADVGPRVTRRLAADAAPRPGAAAATPAAPGPPSSTRPPTAAARAATSRCRRWTRRRRTAPASPVPG